MGVSLENAEAERPVGAKRRFLEGIGRGGLVWIWRVWLGSPMR